MNIFWLDNDLKKCAEYHVNKHVTKMPLESAQILCSSLYYTNQGDLSPYKLTHKNHPCSVWARESLSNWLWLKDLSLELCREYTYRYDRVHKCEGVIRNLPIPNLKDIGFTEFRCAMDDKYIISCDPIVNYRNYYKNGKQHLFAWKRRDMPKWLYA